MPAFVLRFREAFPEYHAPARSLLILRPGRDFPISVVWDVAERHPNYGRVLGHLADGDLEPECNCPPTQVAIELARAIGERPPLLPPTRRPRWRPPGVGLVSD